METKPRIESLVEEWRKGGDDRLLNEIDAELKKLRNGFIGHRNAEHLLVHESHMECADGFQAFAVLNEYGEERDWYLRISIERLPQGQGPLPTLGVINHEPGVSSVCCREMGRSVLISVRQRVQDRDGMYFVGSMHRTRVELVDQLPRFFWDTLQDLVPFRSVFVDVGADRELTPLARRVRVSSSHQGTDDIVEGGSRVMDTVPHQDAEPRWRGLLHRQSDGHLAILEIDDHVEYCTAVFEVADRFLLKEFKMFTP